MQLKQILNVKLCLTLMKYEDSIKANKNYDIFKMSRLIYDCLDSQRQKFFHTDIMEAKTKEDKIEVCLQYCNAYIGSV